MPWWIKQKLWLKELIRRNLDFDGIITFPEHHQSHAAAAFFPSPFRKAAILTIDGVGEWTTTSFGIGQGNTIELLAELRFPHSLGLLYSAFTYFTGFKVNSGEYKLMGLAPYGKPIYRDLILNELIDLKEDGSFKLNMKYFSYPAGLRMTNSRFERLFGGPPRQPQGALTQREMDMARSIQDVTEEIMLRCARHVHKETGQEYLCLAGGVALNCVGNGRILRESPFRDIWIQPASSDAGGALGAALLTWHQYLGKDRQVNESRDSQHGSYLGPEYDNEHILQFLRDREIAFTELSDTELSEIVADLIAKEKVIGWFQGRMEFGPRALGNRSIIGNPRSASMQETMNRKIKFRESFRPFAPSVLKERVGDYFELDRESPYMLLVAEVNEAHRREDVRSRDAAGLDMLKIVRSDIPAVTHVDYSARIQTVSREDNPRFHDLIAAFERKHGCPLVINTSFNVRGEPIVCTPEEAHECFMRTQMDYLVMGNFLIEKTRQRRAASGDTPMPSFEPD